MHRRIGLRVLSILGFFAHTSQHILLVIHLDLRLTSHRSVAHSGIGSQLAEHIGLVLHRDIVCLTRSQILELLVVLAALVETDIGDIQSCRPDTQAIAQVFVYLLVDKARPFLYHLIGLKHKDAFRYLGERTFDRTGHHGFNTLLHLVHRGVFASPLTEDFACGFFGSFYAEILKIQRSHSVLLLVHV